MRIQNLIGMTSPQFSSIQAAEARHDGASPPPADGYRVVRKSVPADPPFYDLSSLVNIPAILPYSLSKYWDEKDVFIGEILCGVTIAFAQIPESVAFGFMAGVNPINAVHAAWMSNLIITLLGCRPGLIAGCDGAKAAVLIVPVALLGEGYVPYWLFGCGVIQIICGVLRLGKLVRLIPHSVMIGFVNGLAIIIAFSQLHAFSFTDYYVDHYRDNDANRTLPSVGGMPKGGSYVPPSMGIPMVCIAALTFGVIMILPKLLALVKDVPGLKHLQRLPAPGVAIAIATIVEALLRKFTPYETPLVGEVAPITTSWPVPFWKQDQYNIPITRVNVTGGGAGGAPGVGVVNVGGVNISTTLTAVDVVISSVGGVGGSGGGAGGAPVPAPAGTVNAAGGSVVGVVPSPPTIPGGDSGGVAALRAVDVSDRDASVAGVGYTTAADGGGGRLRGAGVGVEIDKGCGEVRGDSEHRKVLPPFTWETVKTAIPAALVCAAVGLIEMVMTVEVVSELTKTPTISDDQQLLGLGIANIVGGFFGNIGGGAMIGLSIMNCAMGVTGVYKISAIATALTVLVVTMVGEVLIRAVPTAALVGVMCIVVIHTFEWSSLFTVFLSALPLSVRNGIGSALRAVVCGPCAPAFANIEARKVPRWDAVIIVIVTFITFYENLVVAVVAGVVICALAYAWSAATHVSVEVVDVPESLVVSGSRSASAMTSPAAPSSTTAFPGTVDKRSGAVEVELQPTSGSPTSPGGKMKRVYHVSGSLFFGSTRYFLRLFNPAEDPEVNETHLSEAIIFDYSGLEVLAVLVQKYQEAGKKMKVFFYRESCWQVARKGRGITSQAQFEKVEKSVEEAPLPPAGQPLQVTRSRM